MYPLHQKVKQRLIASEGRRDGVRIPLSAPGLLSPLRYPTSSGAADCSNKLTALRDIWQRCYFAKDFEGSAMVNISAATVYVDHYLNALSIVGM